MMCFTSPRTFPARLACLAVKQGSQVYLLHYVMSYPLLSRRPMGLNHVVEFFGTLGQPKLHCFASRMPSSLSVSLFGGFSPLLRQEPAGKTLGKGKLSISFTFFLNQTSEPSVFFFSMWVTPVVCLEGTPMRLCES